MTLFAALGAPGEPGVPEWFRAIYSNDYPFPSFPWRALGGTPKDTPGCAREVSCVMK